jgi:hypothetical protein
MFSEAPPDTIPIGYTALVQQFGLRTLPHHRGSFIATKGGPRGLPDGRVVLRQETPRGTTVLEHLTFSLKHDGLNLAIVAAVFDALENPTDFEQELGAELLSKPNGIYLRRLWFLYEWLTGATIGVVDSSARYILLLDADEFVTGPERNSPRHRVTNNLLGERAFCPMVRKTEALKARDPEALHKALTDLVSQYDPDVFVRAISYLYTKETLSSYAIENERPSKTREDRFIRLLRDVHDLEPWKEQALAELQSQIVDPRFAETGYRTVQNYVGQSIGLLRQRVHFIPPRSEDLRTLMDGLIETAKLLLGSQTDPVVVAACLSFGFVFLHPFVDGNGRLHRLLIHNVLSTLDVTPDRVVAPVSAVMVADRGSYDRALETFSKPLLELVEYELNEDGWLTVKGQTASYYRYIDFSDIAEALYGWLERAIREDLMGELDFLVGIERTREAMRAVVDLPDRLADLFIKVCLQNGKTLSATKRGRHFNMLTDDEVSRLEAAVREHMPTRAFSRA